MNYKIPFTSLSFDSFWLEGERSGFLSLPVAISSWSEYRTDDVRVDAFLAHKGESVIIAFDVEEPQLISRYSQHNEPVYTDSCVELFIALDESGGYYNFEFNAQGTCLAAFGKDRSSRESIPSELLRKIKSSIFIERVARGEKDAIRWRITSEIPCELFVKHSIKKLSSQKAWINLYKCGDDLDKPHFLSWRKIETPSPDFHQRSFFDSVEFE